MENKSGRSLLIIKNTVFKNRSKISDQGVGSSENRSFETDTLFSLQTMNWVFFLKVIVVRTVFLGFYPLH